MPRRHVTTAELDALQARNLNVQQFRRAVYALEHGADGLRLLQLQARRDVAADLYKQALATVEARRADGSLKPYQIETLTQAFDQWQAAVRALIDHQSRRRAPAAAE